MNFKEQQSLKVKEIEVLIRKYLPKQEGFAAGLAEAMNYSMLAGGKRLRPMLMQETYTLFKGAEEVIEPFMAAIEMIHTHSLIHDDLPALDNDEYRRGQKTTHAVFGEAMGVLSGDALLNYAYEVAFHGFDLCDEPEKVILALQVLASKTGIYGMLGGQSVDVANDGCPMDLGMLRYIYKNKTSALLEASMMVGAILAGADARGIRSVEAVAERVGLAFQIQDDILDLTSTTQELGKPVHSDEKNHKTTYVTLKGMDEAKKEADRLCCEAMEILEQLEQKNDFLTQLIGSLMNRRK